MNLINRFVAVKHGGVTLNIDLVTVRGAVR